MSNKQPIVSDICEELRTRRKNGETYEVLDNDYTLDLEEILNHMFGDCMCDNNVQSLKSRNDEPWREKYVVQQLYREDEKRFTEMAEILNCHSETAKKYVDKFDVSPIDSSDRTSSPRVNKLMRLGKEGDADITKEP